MLKSLSLNGVGPVEGLSATFGERLNVLTGDNGLGKSFLLDVCFWALTGTWPGGRTALPVPNGKKQKPTITYDIKGRGQKKTDIKTASFEYQTQTWTRPKGRPFKPGLVIYASVDGGFAVWDPARNYWRDPITGTKEGDEQPRAFQFTPETLATGLKEDNRVLSNGLVQDWVNWYYQKDIGNSISGPDGYTEPIFRAFAYLEEVVTILSHPSEPIQCGEPKRVYIDDARQYPVLNMPYGEVPYPQWSAGVRRIISLAYLIVWTWSEHLQAAKLRFEGPTDRFILLVDEIESHLHPKWQRVILPALLKVFQTLKEQTDVQVFAATHSPLILASLEPQFDKEKDKLFWFDLDGKKIHFKDYPWAIQGDVVGWLTSEIFGLKQARSREAEAAIEAAEAFMRKETENLPENLNSKDRIYNELLKTLPGMDPFWPRWILEAN